MVPFSSHLGAGEGDAAGRIAVWGEGCAQLYSFQEAVGGEADRLRNPARRMLRAVIAPCETAANLTLQLLAYSGKGKFIIKSIELSGLVRGPAAWFRPALPKNVQLRLYRAERPRASKETLPSSSNSS